MLLRKATTIFAVAASMALPRPISADPVSAIAGGLAVSNVVDSIKSSINEVIRQMESSVGVSSFRIRQDLSFLAGELDYFANQHREKLFRDLNQSEKHFIEDSRNLVEKTAREARKTMQTATKLSETVESGVSRLPLVDDSPMVRGAYPQYILNEPNREVVTTTIRGNLFGNAENISLTIGDVVCTEIESKDPELSFNCPNRFFTSGNSIKTTSADLKIVVDEPWYVDLWNWISGRKQREKNYKILTYTIPQTLGTYALSGIVEEDVDINKDVTRVLQASNEHCEGERTHGPFRYTPEVGWKIRTETVGVGSEISGNRERSYQGPFELSETGFYYNIKLQNGGSCSPSLFGMRSKDARAWATWPVHWTEYKTETRERPSDPLKGVLKWGQDLSIELPPRTRRFTLTVRQLDGEQKVVTSDDESAGWFVVQTDATRRTLLIKPRELSDAMQAS